MQICNFSKIRPIVFEKIYFFENVALFSCRESQALSPDMQIIILLLVRKE